MQRTLLVFASFLIACGGGDAPAADPDPAPVQQPSAGAETEEAGPPEGRLAADVRPTRYALTLAMDPTRDRFTGVAEIDVDLPHRQTVIYLHGQGLDVSEVTVTESGRDARTGEWASIGDEGLASVTLERPIGPGNVRLRITYGAPFDPNLSGFYRVEQGNEHYIFSQMEPLAARRAFPCFDEPSFKTPYDVTMVVRADDVAIANAREISSTDMSGDLRRVRFATTESIPSYLVAIAVGPFDVVEGDAIPANEVRSAALPFRAIAPRGHGPQLAHAIEHTPAILTWLESYFGSAYPFDKLDLIAVPDFGAGAMENPGAVTFRDSLLLVGEDAPISQQRGFAYVTAHELAHMWFGNLVTMQWWDDLWLNEAFASWMESQTIQATFPNFEPAVTSMEEAVAAMNADSLHSARQIRQPIESSHDIHNAFDAITYLKGQAVLSMFEQWLTPEVFRTGVRAYLSAHAEGNASAGDLLDALSEAAGRDVRGPVNSFLRQPGVPLVEVTPTCEGEQGSLTLRQSRYLPLGSQASREATWQIPFCARYRAGGEVRQVCTVLTETEGQVALEGGCAEWVMPNAGGTGYYRWSLPADQLTVLGRSGLSDLSVREAMSFADSVQSSFAAGRTSYEDAMNAVRPLARRPERALATAPISLTELALDRLLDDAAKTRARRWATRLYRSSWRELGFRVRDGESPDRQLYRRELLSFLALEAEDGPIRREAGQLGRAYLGLRGDGEIHPDAVAPDLASTVVAVAVQQGGERAFNHVLERLLAATDPVARRNLLTGLSRGAREPALRTRLLALTLDPESGLRTNEIFQPLRGQQQDAEGRELVWAWLQANYDALVARMGPFMAGYLPYAAVSHCTTERATEVQAFFAERMEATHGGPRNLAKAVESIELCAARVEHGRGSANTFFAN